MEHFFTRPLKACLFLSLSYLALLAPLLAETSPTAEQIIRHVVTTDKQLVERRKAFDYDIAITREKLDDDKKVTTTIKEKTVVIGGHGPGYGTRTASGDPEKEAEKTSKEEPFELLKMIDHYKYTLEGQEMQNGTMCYKIAFTPKPDQPYNNREEKVLNNVSGHIWADVDSYAIVKNEGTLMRPVSVAWIFATLKEMEFRFDAMKMPNGDFGPGHLMYRYQVSIPFMQLHERDTRVVSGYRATGTKVVK